MVLGVGRNVGTWVDQSESNVIDGPGSYIDSNTGHKILSIVPIDSTIIQRLDVSDTDLLRESRRVD